MTPSFDENAPRQSLERVVLIHGLGSKKFLMKPLELSIRKAGFETRSFGYFSWLGSLEKHASKFERFLDKQLEDCDQLHIVAHSMGTAIARLALTNMHTYKIDKVVLIAPPNQGSPIARIAGPIVRPCCASISQLSSSPRSLTNQIDTKGKYSIGIIAARYDWMIPVRNTHLHDESAHIGLNATHNSLLIQPQAARQAVSFLRHGKFNVITSLRSAA